MWALPTMVVEYILVPTVDRPALLDAIERRAAMRGSTVGFLPRHPSRAFRVKCASENMSPAWDRRCCSFQELIAHHIDVHGYERPEDFQQAVMDCPRMKFVEYLRELRIHVCTAPRSGRLGERARSWPRCDTTTLRVRHPLAVAGRPTPCV